MRRTFDRHFHNWTLTNDDTLSVHSIESRGADVDDMLANAVIYTQTWHGDEGPIMHAGDLSSYDHEQLTKMFTEFLAAVPA